MASKSPKTIATINFKGGVGKTTITWCLGDLISTLGKQNILMFDLDAQMSLTQAIALNEDGSYIKSFEDWHRKAKDGKKTIFDALGAFDKPGENFDFPVNLDFVYEIKKNYHFVPSSEELYWQELDVFDKEKMRDFVRRILGKVQNTKQLPDYDYVFFDCPPSFTLLSYSVLSCCDLILIPVNPDIFASRGVSLILEFLRRRLEPHPLPKIGVFMNKAKTWKSLPTKETAKYIMQADSACRETAQQESLNCRFFDTWIKERAGVKRAITNGLPSELLGDFTALWKECEDFLHG